MVATAAVPRLEVIDPGSLPGVMENEAAVLLYGDRKAAEGVVEKVIRGSDLLVALVNCEELQEGHRQIAVNRPLGKSTYENIVELGFLPDLIVARCRTLGEAVGLIEWTVLGPRLICVVEPKGSDHGRWGTAEAFGLQVFCGSDGAFVTGRVTSSRQSPS